MRFQMTLAVFFFVATATATIVVPPVRAPEEVRFVDGDALALAPQDVHAGAALRFEAFGAATLVLRWKDGGAGPRHLRVEGPLSEGDEEMPGRAPLVAESAKRGLRARLPGAGVYRILPRGAGATPRLDARCRGACTRPTIFLAELVQRLAENERAELSRRIESYLQRQVTDADARARLLQRWRDAMSLPTLDPSAFDRVATVPPLTRLSALRSLLGRLGGAPRPEPQPIDVELPAYLASMEIPPVTPPRAHPRLPERLGYGHFRSRALPPKVLRGSVGLARLLDALAIGGTRVRTPAPGSRTLDSVDGFLRWLVASGHDVALLGERTYANFLSLTWNDMDVRWPVWLDTGLVLDDDSTLVVPTGHSQFTWSVRGPVVNGDVGFFLGSDSGAGFYPRIDVRPDWAVSRVIETSRDRDRIVATGAAAATYLRRIRREAATVAAGMPADGYGYLGICNDATALLQAATGRPVDVYPVVRASELRRRSPVRDHLNDALAGLPNDGETDPTDARYRRGALCRALRMSPFRSDSPALLDDRLRDQLQRAEREVGRACSP